MFTFGILSSDSGLSDVVCVVFDDDDVPDSSNCHKITNPSSLPVAKSLLSGEKRTQFTGERCLVRLDNNLNSLFSIDQIYIFL